MQTEVVIIGGGIIGSSIAYHLARQGRKALVIERSDIATEPAASWASAGGVRRQGRHPTEARLASEAIARWKTLEEELDADLHYRQGGNLLVAESEVEALYLEHFVKQQQAIGFSDVCLLQRQELHALVPGLAASVIAGSYSPADGQADPPATTRAFARAAQRHGAVYWTETAVLELTRDGGRVTGARTERGVVQAEQVVLAAGAWSDDLARGVGLNLPIRTYALQMLLSTSTSSLTLQPVISAVGRHLSLKQLRDGSFFIGGGWLGDPTPDRRSYMTRASSIEGNWDAARTILPSVGEQNIARAWCGLEAQSIDGIPFIGPTSDLAGLTMALGFSGHGFAIAPAIGRAVADQLAGKATPELNGLSPRRLIHFTSKEIDQFLHSKHEGNTLEQRG